MNFLEYARIAQVADTPYIKNQLLRQALERADGDNVTALAARIHRHLKGASHLESIAALEFVCSQIRAEIILNSRN